MAVRFWGDGGELFDEVVVEVHVDGVFAFFVQSDEKFLEDAFFDFVAHAAPVFAEAGDNVR